MQTNDVLGIDVGLKHTGIARASQVARLAEPLITLPTAEVLDNLRELIEGYKIETIVVGLPRNLKGEDTAQTKWLRQWVKQAKKAIPATFYWQDEALTSKAVENVKHKVESKFDDHALAASIILQDWLNSSVRDDLVAA